MCLPVADVILPRRAVMERTDVRKQVDKHFGQGTSDKLEGRAKEMAGKVKEKAGGIIGDGKMQTEGEARHAEGTLQRHKGEAKEKIEDAGEAIKEKMDKLKGGAQAIADKVRDKLDQSRH
jgi:uncharacterized protein YjbJ (UPF0337 family)